MRIIIISFREKSDESIEHSMFVRVRNATFDVFADDAHENTQKKKK